VSFFTPGCSPAVSYDPVVAKLLVRAVANQDNCVVLVDVLVVGAVVEDSQFVVHPSFIGIN